MYSNLFIQKGIQLHFEIDAFTDSHEIVTKSKVRLRDHVGHYAPVVADIFYDYYLANHWNLYHKVPLEQFASAIYGVLQKWQTVLPEEVLQFLPAMRQENWLVNYGNFDGIKQTFEGMARRTSFQSNMESAVHVLKKEEEQFNEEFLTFFPQLIQHVQYWKDKNM